MGPLSFYCVEIRVGYCLSEKGHDSRAVYQLLEQLCAKAINTKEPIDNAIDVHMNVEKMIKPM